MNNDQPLFQDKLLQIHKEVIISLYEWSRQFKDVDYSIMGVNELADTSGTTVKFNIENLDFIFHADNILIDIKTNELVLIDPY